jgi:hypothetical protein
VRRKEQEGGGGRKRDEAPPCHARRDSNGQLGEVQTRCGEGQGEGAGVQRVVEASSEHRSQGPGRYCSPHHSTY